MFSILYKFSSFMEMVHFIGNISGSSVLTVTSGEQSGGNDSFDNNNKSARI